MSLTQVLEKIDATQDDAMARLFELLRIPSISTAPERAGDVQRAADWILADLESLGATVTKHETPLHPMITGTVGSGAPHLLFYGHYDVQPVDPLELWHRDPFDPALEDTPNGPVIRGRGTNDDKGQAMTFLEACRAWIAVNGALPCKISFIFEGEEEIGSPSLVPFLEANKDLIKADVALICDTSRYDRDTPAITTMLRGLMGDEFTVKAANRDLHSGSFGGPSANPLRVISQILASLHDAEGRVTLPGFYDGVAELDPEISAQWEGLGFDGTAFLNSVDLSLPAGESGRSVLEMIWSRPTLEINGVWGGYNEPGFKTVLPAEAHAKISCRLVGTQDAHKIRAALRARIEDMLPADCSVEFKSHGSGAASVMATDSPIFEKARQALSDEWPKPAAFIGAGGSIPIAGHFKDILGMDSMLIGFGMEDDALHSPNEKYDVMSFHKGIRSWARILDAVTR